MLLLLSVGAWEVAFAKIINYGIHDMKSELENNAMHWNMWLVSICPDIKL